MPGPFASIQRAADEVGRDYGTIVNRIKRKELRVYRLPGKRAHHVDLTEVRALFAKEAKYGSFGGEVEVIDFSNHVGTDFEVVE